MVDVFGGNKIAVNVSNSNSNKIVSVTNDVVLYYSDLAKKFANEAEKFLNSTKEEVINVQKAQEIAIKAIDDEVKIKHNELKGEKGEQGPPGPQGIQGEKGEAGAGALWGNIDGNITQQVDLFNCLSLKVNAYNITDYLMPDYAQQIYGEAVSGTLMQVSKDSSVIVWGSDGYAEDYYAFVTDDVNNPYKFAVGRRYDDTTTNTEATTFSFQVPKNWYFTCTAEYGFGYRIFPYKGAN